MLLCCYESQRQFQLFPLCCILTFFPSLYLVIEFVFQIQVSYYPPGQYPSSGQQYRVPQSMSHQVSYPAQRTQPIPQPTQQSGQYGGFWHKSNLVVLLVFYLY